MLGAGARHAGKGIKDGGLGKTPGAGKAVRRVLGDVTNTTPGLQQKSSAAKPAAVVLHTQSRAELYAADGLERRAGNGWRQLESERLQRESTAAQQRARDAILPWATRRLPSQVTNSDESACERRRLRCPVCQGRACSQAGY